MTTNTYAKFAPNVFVAKCTEPHEKGEVIVLTSKYGNETESVSGRVETVSGDIYHR